MGILEFPRIHFSGTAYADVATANNNNSSNIDLSTLTLYNPDGTAVDYNTLAKKGVNEFQEGQRKNGGRYDSQRVSNQYGGYSTDAGWNQGGSNSFGFLNTKVTSVEYSPDQIVADHTVDPIVGVDVQLLGHFNPYTQAQNQARMIDLDSSTSATDSTTNILGGMFSIGNNPAVNYQPAPIGFNGLIPDGQYSGCRDIWLANVPPRGSPGSYMGSGTFQFSLPTDQLNIDITNRKSKVLNDIVAALGLLIGQETPLIDPIKGKAVGLLVRYTIYNMNFSVGRAILSLTGTVGLWFEDELQTINVDRYLAPQLDLPQMSEVYQVNPFPTSLVGTSVFKIYTYNNKKYLAFNTLNTFGVTVGPQPNTSSPPALQSRTNVGPLHIFYKDSHNKEISVATIPAEYLNLDYYLLRSGQIDVPVDDPSVDFQGAFYVVSKSPTPGSHATNVIILTESAERVLTDSLNVYVEFPDEVGKNDYERAITVRSYKYGLRASRKVNVFQYYNLRFFPNWAYNGGDKYQYPLSTEYYVLKMKETGNPSSEYGYTLTLTTNDKGVGSFTVKSFKPLGAQAGYYGGSAKISLELSGPVPQYDPGDPDPPPPSLAQYTSLYWMYGSSVNVRVLPDDWAIYYDSKNQNFANVTYDYVVDKIFKYYEVLFPFMSTHILSFLNQAKVEAQIDMIEQITTPSNRDKTYYMPITRDLSLPKALLLHEYYLQYKAKFPPPPLVKEIPPPLNPSEVIYTREQLIQLLQDACELEHGLMIQYLYAAWSIPTYQQATELNWLELYKDKACGYPVVDTSGGGRYPADDPENQNNDKKVWVPGWRDIIVEIARQEMLHFLLANNILIAVGGPPHVTRPAFPLNLRYYPLDAPFSLEPFHVDTVARFVKFEYPQFFDNPSTTPTPGHEDPGLLFKDGASTLAYARTLSGTPLVPADAHPAVSNNNNNNRSGPVFSLASASTSTLTQKELGNTNYESVATLYKKIIAALRCLGNTAILNPQGNQSRGSWNLFMSPEFVSKFPNYNCSVYDVDSAVFAIEKVILEQGEGADPTSPSFQTSHYARFLRMFADLGKLEYSYLSDDNNTNPPWRPSFPGMSNPAVSIVNNDYSPNLITNEPARKLADIFNRSYTVMLEMIICCLGSGLADSMDNFRFGKLFNIAITIMVGVLKPIGEDLFTMPSGSPLGTTAGPPFTIVTDPGFLPLKTIANTIFETRISEILKDAQALNAPQAGSASTLPPVRQSVIGVLSTIAQQLKSGVMGYAIKPVPLSVTVDTEPINNSLSCFVSLDTANQLTLLDTNIIYLEYVNSDKKKTIYPVLFAVNQKTESGSVTIDQNAASNLDFGNDDQPRVTANYVIQDEVPTIDTVNISISGAPGQILTHDNTLQDAALASLNKWFQSRPLSNGLTYTATIKIDDKNFSFTVHIESINIPQVKIAKFGSTSKLNITGIAATH